MHQKYALINHKAGSNQCALDMEIDQPPSIVHLNGKITFKIRRISTRLLRHQHEPK